MHSFYSMLTMFVTFSSHLHDNSYTIRCYDDGVEKIFDSLPFSFDCSFLVRYFRKRKTPATRPEFFIVLFIISFAGSSGGCFLSGFCPLPFENGVPLCEEPPSHGAYGHEARSQENYPYMTREVFHYMFFFAVSQSSAKPAAS